MMLDSAPLLRHAVAGLAQGATGWRWCGGTDDPRAVWAGVGRSQPEVLLVDSGLDPSASLVGEICAAHPGLAVVVFLDRGQQNARYLAAVERAGAAGTICRSAEAAELFAGLRRAYTTRWGRGHSLARPRTDAEVEDDNTSATSGEPLSARQLQVLERLAAGRSNTGVAEDLYVSVETVRTHVKGILTRLHARDRAHAIARAYQLRVLTLPNTPTDPDTRSTSQATVKRVAPVRDPQTAALKGKDTCVRAVDA
jgi:DNA-binding NarL/FixJ family response regulator